MSREFWYEIRQVMDDGETRPTGGSSSALGVAVDAALEYSSGDPDRRYFVDRWVRDTDTEHQDAEPDENFECIWFKDGDVTPDQDDGVFVTVEQSIGDVVRVRVFRTETDADLAEHIWRGEQDVSYDPDDIEDREDAFERLAETGTAFHMKECHIE